MTAVARAARLPVRGPGVDVLAALNLVGAMTSYLALAFLVPLVVALAHGERAWSYAVAGVATGLVGVGTERATRGRGAGVGLREGFLVVALTWAVAALAVSLPYMLSGEEQIASPLDAYFEAMSGMTTTGASVLTDIPALDTSLLLWRQLSQWLGGMGIIVLALAVLPRLGVAGRQLVESEMPGPEYEPLATSIRATARRLWIVYVGLTGLLILVLCVLGWTGVDDRMSEFEAVAHALTTLPTGGFGTQPDSVAGFSGATQWTLAAFMLLAGVSFALHWRMLRRRANPARDEELRYYLLIVVVAVLIVFLELVHAGLFSAGEDALRHAVFQVASIITTTGFASADFAQWTFLTSMVLVLLMLIGGCAGSTSGAMKVVRVVLVAKLLRRELDLTAHPEAIEPIRFNGRVVDERTVRAITSFGLLYLVVFLLGALVLTIESAAGNVEIGAFDGIAASATTLGNVGPGFGFAGPFGSFDPFNGSSKALMVVLMWMGRLELVPVAILLTRRYWR